jgi:hypothetical protein
MDLRPSWETTSLSVTQEFPNILRKAKVHYYGQKSPPLVPTQSRINPVYTTQSNFYKISGSQHRNYHFKSLWNLIFTHFVLICPNLYSQFTALNCTALVPIRFPTAFVILGISVYSHGTDHTENTVSIVTSRLCWGTTWSLLPSNKSRRVLFSNGLSIVVME